MSTITYTLKIGGTDVDCHALRRWTVTMGRKDDVSAPSPGSGSFTLVYDGDDFNSSGLTPGDLVEFDAVVAGRTFPIARHYLASLDRDWSFEVPDGRSRVSIKTVGKIQSLNRKHLGYADPWGGRGYIPALTPTSAPARQLEPLYIPGETNRFTDGVRAWQVVKAAGHTITAPAQGAAIIDDDESSGVWDCWPVKVGETVETVTRAAPITIPAADTYILSIQCEALAGDNTLDVRPRIGSWVGGWQALNTRYGFDRWTGEAVLPAGSHPVVMEVRGTPPPLTWATSGGITANDGQPAETWGNTWGPTWQDDLACDFGPTWDAMGTLTWSDLGFDWTVHRGVFRVESFTVTDSSAAWEWGDDLIAYRDTNKDTPNEPVNRGDYVRSCTAAARSVVHETRGDDPSEFVYFPRRMRQNSQTRPPVLVLDACDIQAATKSSIAGWRICTEVTWGYGDPVVLPSGDSERDVVKRTRNTTGSLLVDDVQVNYDGPLLLEADAGQVADYVLATFDTPREDITELSTIPLEAMDPDDAGECLTANCGELLRVVGDLPGGWVSAGAPWSGWIEGHQLDGDETTTRLTFTLTAA